MWRSALTCRSVRRAAGVSPQAALAMPLAALPENVRADNAGRHAGVGGGLRNARSNDIYQPSHAAACGLVFSSLDHAWLLNALLTGALVG